MVKEKEVTYHCGFCGNSFRSVAQVTGGQKNNRCISNQIKCKRCNNFLPTWKDKVDRQVVELNTPDKETKNRT